MEKKYAALKVSVLGGLLTATVFGVFSLVFYFGDWKRFAVVFSLGLFVGLLAAPEFEPDAFKYPRLFQSFSGAASGALVGVVFSFPSEYIFMTSIIGGVIGWLAPFWVKHVPIP